jgi:hypothetical protein
VNTGECGERRLEHPEEAEKFYRDLFAAEANLKAEQEEAEIPQSVIRSILLSFAFRFPLRSL